MEGTREELEAKIKLWDGVNKYIVKEARRALAKLDGVDKPVKKSKEKESFAEKAGDMVEDLLDDGKLNKSNKRKAKRRRK